MEKFEKGENSMKRTSRKHHLNINSSLESNLAKLEHQMNYNEDEKTKKKRLKYSKYIFMFIGLIMIATIASLCLLWPILKSNELTKQQAIRNEFFSRKILSVDDSKVYYEDKLEKSSWEKLRENLKQIVLNSKLNFQGQIVEVKNLFNPRILNTLTFEEINNVLKGKQLAIGREIANNVEFYIERRFIHEDVKMMRFEYEYGHDYEENYENHFEFSKNRTKSRTFKEFYDKFMNQSDRFEIIDKVRENAFFRRFSYDLTDESFHFLNKSSADIIEQAYKERMLVFMSELDSGKTATLQQLASKIKNKYPTKWISHVSLKSHERFYRPDGIVVNVEALLIKILGLDTGNNDYEVEVFKESFKSGNFVIFWDDFDKVSTEFHDFLLNLFKLIHENSANIQFMSTEDSYSTQLRKVLKSRFLIMLPFDRDQQRVFLRKYFISQNITSDKISEKMDITEKIFNKFNFAEEFNREFNTPTEVKLIADLHRDENLYHPENIYKIYETIVQNKIDLWIDGNEELVGSKSKNSISQLLKKTFQKYTFYNELIMFAPPGGIGLKLLKLEVMRTEIPKGWTFDEISKMRIFLSDGQKDLKFFHQTFSDFFLAQYFIENIFNSHGSIDKSEAEIRLEIFCHFINGDGNSKQIIADFMTSFLKTRNKIDDKPFNSEISKLLRTKFKNIFFRTLHINDPKFFEFIFEFFEKDHSLLVDLLHLHEDETLYTAIFNPSHFALFVDPVEIKNLSRKYLTEQEHGKFVTGNDQKGVIQMGMYFYSLLNVSKSDDAHRTELVTLNSENISFWQFLFKIKDSLTLIEEQKVFSNLLSPKIYLFYDTLFRSSYLPKYKQLWSNVESLSTKSQLTELLGNSFLNYLEIFPGGKKGYKNLLSFLLQETEKLLSDREIYEMFLNKNILHEALWGDFEAIWNFLSNHTTNEQRRTILLQDDFDDKNFFLYQSYIDAKENFSSYGYPYYPYDFTPFKIFHRSLLRPPAPTYDFTKEIYQNHFNRTEMQSIIFSSDDFLAYAMICTEHEPFERFTAYLEELFKGNEKSLKEKLNRKIKPTNLSALEFVKELTRFESVYLDLPSNIKIFNGLYIKL